MHVGELVDDESSKLEHVKKNWHFALRSELGEILAQCLFGFLAWLWNNVRGFWRRSGLGGTLADRFRLGCRGLAFLRSLFGLGCAAVLFFSCLFLGLSLGLQRGFL